MTPATIAPEEPFQTVLREWWLPAAMSTPPALDPAVPRPPVMPRHALLLNPFYPKDPHASCGKHVLTPEELAHGYGWPDQRLFSGTSIWRRRRRDAGAVRPYLAMSYLYKRSNRFWHFLIRHNLTHAVWSPLVEVTRRRHVRFRRALARRLAPGPASGPASPGTVVSAGV